MIEVDENRSGDGLIVMRVNGRLMHADYERLVPALEEVIREYGGIRCLIELTDLAGIEPRAIWDELRFDVKHARDIERCAVVGDRRWERWATVAAKPMFSHAQVRFFDEADLDSAEQWVRQDDGGA